MIRGIYAFLALCLFAFAIACTEPEPDNVFEPENTENTEETTTSDNTAGETSSMATLDGFLATFKEAVATKDVEKLEYMCDMEAMGEDYFNDDFFATWSEKVAALDAAAFMPSEQVAEAMEFQLEELAVDENGDEVGTAVSFIVKTVDGEYMIVAKMEMG